MPQEDLINFIKERLTEGFDEKSIREALVETGHSQEEIEKAFQLISGEKEALGELPPERELPKEEVLPYQLREEEILTITPRVSAQKKFLLPLIILVALIFVGGASAFILSKLLKPEPISLLPQEVAFYLRLKINPEDKQVKNLKELLDRFPYYEKLSQKISEEFEKMKKENPPLRNLDFTISDELILAWILPLEFKPGGEMKEFPLVLILPDPDLKKLEKLAKDVQAEIEKSKDWKLETETYQGRTIYKAVPTQESVYKPLPGEPKLEPSTTFTNGHFVLATKPEDIKKIIDVAEDQKITKVFKKDKIKNINSGIVYRRIKRYLPKDYLALFYGELDWSKILKTAEMTGTVKETEKILPPLLASLKTALNLPFFKGKEVEEPEKMAFASVIIAEKNEIKSETFTLDLRKDAFVPSQFSFKDSLANFLPEKIGNQEIAYYGEGRDLKSSFEEVEKVLTKEMTVEEKKDFEEFLNSLKESIGVDLKEDIIALFEKNYAFLITSEPTGKETPAISFIFEVNDENKTKENLLKINIPKGITPFEIGFEGARSKARDARREADLRMIQIALELYSTDFKRYPTTLSQLKPKYISDIPTDPSTDKSYTYQVRQGGKSYILSANLEAGKMIIYTPQGREEIPGELPPSPEIEKVSFSKEIVDGFEIYSLPVFENFGLNFSTKDKKLVFTLTKEGLINVLKSLVDPNQKKLKDSTLFTENFKEIPKEITGISYLSPYGFLGLMKWGTGFILEIYLQGIGAPLGLEAGELKLEKSKATIFEFLDRGIAPYLKVLKSSGEYSYSPERGLIVSKGRLIISELSAEEKKATEEFWGNIQKWFGENFGSLFVPLPDAFPIIPAP